MTAAASTNPQRRRAPKRETLRTWTFDSAGRRKYALQLQRASNGNPCLRVVEGVPQEDGTFRRFTMNFWSEDFDALFSVLDQVRAHIQEHDIRTPDGHRWTPNRDGRKKTTPPPGRGRRD